MSYHPYVAIIIKPDTWFISDNGYQHPALYHIRCKKLRPLLKQVESYTRDYNDDRPAYGYVYQAELPHFALREKDKGDRRYLKRVEMAPEDTACIELLQQYKDLAARGIVEPIEWLVDEDETD